MTILSTAVSTLETRIHRDCRPPSGWNTYLATWGYDGFHLRSEWATVFEQAFRHPSWFLWATEGSQITGVLPLVLVKSRLFGRFLVSQPYLNTGGVLADNPDAAQQLINSAVELADELDVRSLELRHEQHHDHPLLNSVSTEKVNMRRQLPETADELWDSFRSKFRTKIRKPLKNKSLTTEFGHTNQLEDFYTVFCRNMRDLGTPPFSKRLFGAMLEQFGDNAEICTVRLDGVPVASGFTLHDSGVSFIPSVGALRKYNLLSGNMLMYWRVLERAVERGSAIFDFGRSTTGAGTWNFKKSWGAEESPAVWQYHRRGGHQDSVTIGSGKYDRIIRAWQKLPVWVTQLIGPEIVRGIP